MTDLQKGLKLPRRQSLAALFLLLVFSAGACRVIDRTAPATAPGPSATTAAPLAVTPSKTTALQATRAAPAERPTAAPSAADAADPAAVMQPGAAADLAVLPAVPEYSIDLQIDSGLANFTGRMRLDYTNLEDQSLDRLYLRLLPNGGESYGGGSLTVGAVSIDGASLPTGAAPDDPSVLDVQLPAPLSQGGRTRVELDFAGQVPKDFGGGEKPSGYGIYNLTGGVLALSGWYPILAVYDENGWNLDPVSAQGDSVYSDTAFYSVNICAPADVVIAATGVQTASEQNGEDACRQYESGPTRDFMLMGSREYQILNAEADGTAVNSYYLPGHEPGAQRALDIVVKSLEIFNEKFGAYPFVELDVMDAPMRNALGVEYPGIILVGSSLYDEPERDDFAVATAHEVAHQWWYSVIGNDVFASPWLDEGLTTFSSSLYYEFGLSKAANQGLWDYWQNRYDRLLQSGRDGPVTESLAYFDQDPANRSYSTVVYVKGGLFFRALRQEIGDAAFFTALQQYYRAHKYGIAVNQDLLDAFEIAAGRSLDEFYQQWLY